MSGVVVDASLAAKWVLQEPLTAEARALLIDWEQQDIERLVPALFLSEISSPLLRRLGDGDLTLTQAEAAWSTVPALVCPTLVTHCWDQSSPRSSTTRLTTDLSPALGAVHKLQEQDGK